MCVLRPMCYCRALPALSWLCGPRLMCLSREPLHMCLRNESHVSSGPCRPSCTQKPCMLEMVHLSWPAAHVDHFHKVVADQPSDGPIATTGPHGHVQSHSDGCWPTSLSEVHGSHVSACASCNPCIIIVVPSATF